MKLTILFTGPAEGAVASAGTLSAAVLRIFSVLMALSLTVSVQRACAHDASYYSDYTNTYPTQLYLDLAPDQVVYWDGSSVNVHVVASGYSYPRTYGAPGAGLVINRFLDGAEIAPTSLYFGAGYPNQVTTPVPLLDLPVGSHTITVQHTNSFEYYTECIYSYTGTHFSWPYTYYHTYYNRYHYLVLPCVASKTFTVKPSPNFRKLQISRTNVLVSVTYTGLPTNNYAFQFSLDLSNWYPLSVAQTSTNGRVQFFDHYYPGYLGACYYRVYGP